MIRKLLMVAPALLISLALPVSAQREHPVAQAFSAAISRSDMNSLTALLDDEVELMQPGSSGTYRKQVAGGKVADFLRQNPPSQFMVRHQGSSADGQVYAIGQLTTRNGSNYKVVLRARPAAARPNAAQPDAARPGTAGPGAQHYKIFKLDFQQNL